MVVVAYNKRTHRFLSLDPSYIYIFIGFSGFPSVRPGRLSKKIVYIFIYIYIEKNIKLFQRNIIYKMLV